MVRRWTILAMAALTGGCMDLDFSGLAGLEGWADCGSGGFMSSCGSRSGGSGAPGPREIQGTITKNGAPLRGVQVGGPVDQVLTDSLGWYQVVIPRGEEAVFEDSAADPDGIRRLRVDPSGVSRLDIDFDAFEYEVTGTVYAGGRPAAGRTVRIVSPPFILDQETSSDSLGVFRLTGRLVRTQCDSLRVASPQLGTTHVGSCGSHRVQIGG